MKEAILLVDKKPGPTSFDIVREIKKNTGSLKVGHAGTLDPFASGLMVLLVGKATRLSQSLSGVDKSYSGTLKLGETTNSLDRTGTVTDIDTNIGPYTVEQVEKVLHSFQGVWLQTPPAFSAKKVKGVRLYKLARQNINIVLQPSPVTIHHIKLLSYDHPWIHFEVVCSKGTYVRSLAAEVGKRLGTLAYLYDLKRTRCGNFKLEESLSLEKLLDAFEISMQEGFKRFNIAIANG